MQASRGGIRQGLQKQAFGFAVWGLRVRAFVGCVIKSGVWGADSGQRDSGIADFEPAFEECLAYTVGLARHWFGASVLPIRNSEPYLQQTENNVQNDSHRVQKAGSCPWHARVSPRVRVCVDSAQFQLEDVPTLRMYAYMYVFMYDDSSSDLKVNNTCICTYVGMYVCM